MRQLFEKIKEELAAGQDLVLVTVTAGWGSVPRGAGARMLTGVTGRLWGTIGGGAVEHQALRRAAEALENRSCFVEEYPLHENQVRDIGMVCGGDVTVHFQYLSAADASVRKLTDDILDAYRKKKEAWLIQEVTPGKIGGMRLYFGREGEELPEEIAGKLTEKPGVCEGKDRRYYCEKLFPAGIVYIFGGGHVAQALVPVLASVDFRCVVLEDREEFCRKELFLQAEEVRLIQNGRIRDFVDIRQEDYVCIMTRGHKDDMLVQAQVLGTPASYIGVIGSRRKAAAVAKRLETEWGISKENLERIHTPIGLEIGAETPAEIAISITAELIRHRSGLA